MLILNTKLHDHFYRTHVHAFVHHTERTVEINNFIQVTLYTECEVVKQRLGVVLWAVQLFICSRGKLDFLKVSLEFSLLCLIYFSLVLVSEFATGCFYLCASDSSMGAS